MKCGPSVSVRITPSTWQNWCAVTPLVPYQAIAQQACYAELRQLGSIVIQKADEHAVPAGGALAVDRGYFSQDLTATLSQHPLIELRRGGQQIPPEGVVVLATGTVDQSRASR